MPTRDFPVPVGSTTCRVDSGSARAAARTALAWLRERYASMPADCRHRGIDRHRHVVPRRGGARFRAGPRNVVGTGAGQVDPARIAEQPIGCPVLAQGHPVLVQAELAGLQVALRSDWTGMPRSSSRRSRKWFAWPVVPRR